MSEQPDDMNPNEYGEIEAGGWECPNCDWAAPDNGGRRCIACQLAEQARR